MSGVDQVVPMCRLTERMVRSTLVTAWFLADCPTSTSPLRAKATTDGVVRAPSEFAMTVGSPPSRTATTELVVPRSMPTARAMVVASEFLQPVRLPCVDCAQVCHGCDPTFEPDLESPALNLLDGSNVRPGARVPEPVQDVLLGAVPGRVASGTSSGWSQGTGCTRTCSPL